MDATERVLWRGEELLVLPPKVFDTLWTLVRTEGRVVSKSELMEAIWADAFVEESNLSQNIYTLRRTLGVDEQGRKFIETVPRRGYRFAVPVKLLDEVSNDGAKQTEVVVLNKTRNSKAEPEMRGGERRVLQLFAHRHGDVSAQTFFTAIELLAAQCGGAPDLI